MGTARASEDRWWIARNYLLGLCVSGLGAALLWHFHAGFWKEPLAEPAAAAMERREALLAEAQARRTADISHAPAPERRSACSFEPLVPVANAADGQVRMEHPFPAGPRARAKVFLRIADRAAASGRLRDAELALIAACRYSDEASTAPTVPLARVLALLGDHYLAAAGRSPALREELVARAREVLAHSANTYAQALGPNAARSRQARQRVAALDNELIIAAEEVAEPRDAPRLAAQLDRAPLQKQRVARAREAAGPPARQQLAAVRVPPPVPPARDLRRTPPEPGHRPEPLDPELRQLASDLARLRAQAEAVSEDPQGLRRRAAAAEAERARCRDAACLREWYAHRRQQLFAEF